VAGSMISGLSRMGCEILQVEKAVTSGAIGDVQGVSF
jgi:hypothetical protein